MSESLTHEAFITGSHAYGTPTAESDVDLVVYCSSDTRLKLMELTDSKTVPIRFGNLNLILPCDDFEKWRNTTDYLCALAKMENRSIGHEEAKSVFKAAGIGHYRSTESRETAPKPLDE